MCIIPRSPPPYPQRGIAHPGLGCLDQNGFSFASYDLQLPDIPKVDMQEGAPLAQASRCYPTPSVPPRALPCGDKQRHACCLCFMFHEAGIWAMGGHK